MRKDIEKAALDTPSKRKSPEAALHAPIRRLLERQGLSVWSEATIRAGDEGTRTADHVAWSWEGDRIDARAVEVKARNADAALAQGLAYGVGFDHTYVAATESLAPGGYVARVFERLGLGYIHATPRTARIEVEARKSAFLARAARDENIGRIRLKHLWDSVTIGEPTRFGTDRRGPIWGVTGNTKQWQICVLLYPNSTHAYLSLVAESKGLGSRVATRSTSAAFMDAVEQLGVAHAELHLRRREHRFQPRYEDRSVWRPIDGVGALDDLLADARTLTGTRVGPWFEMRTNLWPHSARRTETQAQEDLRAAIDRMRPVRDSLNRMVGR